MTLLEDNRGSLLAVRILRPERLKDDFELVQPVIDLGDGVEVLPSNLATLL